MADAVNEIVFIPTDLLSGNCNQNIEANKDALLLRDHSSVFYVAPRAGHGDGRDTRDMNMNVNAQTQRADNNSVGGQREHHGLEASSPIARVGRLH